MANHSMVYGISGDSYNDLGALIRAGIIDYHFLIHGGGNTPPAQFPKDCRAVGGSPVLNNGNDGVPGWNGQASYYKNVAALGYMAAGGESEQAPEIDSIMDNLIFMDYGGAGTGGGTNDDVWNVTHPAPVHGHGAASYLETYGYSSDFWPWSVVGNGVLHAKQHGVKEIGILVGNWIYYHSTAQDYIDLARAYESHGVTCAGIVVWGGYGTNMNQLYSQFANWFKIWQAIWPPNMTPMDKRYAGIVPPPVTAPTIPTLITFNQSNATPKVGEKVELTATLLAGAIGARKPLAGKAVKIWHTLNNIRYDDFSGTTNANGAVSVTQTFNSKAQRPYYATFAGDGTYMQSQSGALQVI